MVIYKFWQSKKKIGNVFSTNYERILWEGWFLFGIIPLYVRMLKREKY